MEEENGTGGMKSGPCLIAGFHALSDTHPSYWNPYRLESGAVFSIDMVRLKLTFIGGKDGGLWLIIHAQYPPQHDIKSRLGLERRKP